MNAALKRPARRTPSRHWPLWVWLVLIVGGAYVAGTVAVGMELYAATENPMVANNR